MNKQETMSFMAEKYDQLEEEYKNGKLSLYELEKKIFEEGNKLQSSMMEDIIAKNSVKKKSANAEGNLS